MSALTDAPLRTLAFGDLDAGVWGVAWGRSEPFVAVGTIDPRAVQTIALASIDGSSPGQAWVVRGQGIELTVSPESEPVASSALEGFDQLCRVWGRFTLVGADHDVECLGCRGGKTGVDLRQAESIRDFCAWFAPGEGVALTALRPRGANGHNRDIVVASVFEPGGAVAVADPRLSTPYATDGRPSRVSLELWLEDDESEDQYPRRAAGETLGVSAAWAQGELDCQAYAFACHSRGHEGAGVYVLARPK
jgi:hypothetical protein